MAQKVKWEEANFKWNDNPHLWDLVQIIEEVTTTGGAIAPELVKKLDKKKKKKLVRLIMHKNGTKIYDEEKEVKSLHLKVKDIEIIAEEIKRHVQIIH